MKIVFDSSTLILLSKISMLDTVSGHFECIITKEVEKEVLYKRESFDAKLIDRLVVSKKIKVERLEAGKKMEYEFNLGKGEVSSIALASKLKTALATDDKAAIKACKILGIEFVTAIDFVLRAFEKRMLTYEEAHDKIIKLDKYGRYHTDIIKKSLEELGDKNE